MSPEKENKRSFANSNTYCESISPRKGMFLASDDVVNDISNDLRSVPSVMAFMNERGHSVSKK